MFGTKIIATTMALLLSASSFAAVTKKKNIQKPLSYKEAIVKYLSDNGVTIAATAAVVIGVYIWMRPRAPAGIALAGAAGAPVARLSEQQIKELRAQKLGAQVTPGGNGAASVVAAAPVLLVKRKPTPMKVITDEPAVTRSKTVLPSNVEQLRKMADALAKKDDAVIRARIIDHLNADMTIQEAVETEAFWAILGTTGNWLFNHFTVGQLVTVLDYLNELAIRDIQLAQARLLLLAESLLYPALNKKLSAKDAQDWIKKLTQMRKMHKLLDVSEQINQAEVNLLDWALGLDDQDAEEAVEEGYEL